MSDFSLSLDQRRRLLAEDYRPLHFKGVADPEGKDPLPAGCKVGARYVLVWTREDRIHLGDGEVAVVPAVPEFYIVVAKILGGPERRWERPDGSWLVKYDVFDFRDRTVWLRRGGGYQSSAMGAADSRPIPVVDKSVRDQMQAEFWHQRRLAEFARVRRERNRARRQRAA